jgi:hypothetical protein
VNRHVQVLCSCQVRFKKLPQFMGGGPRPDWQHAVHCQIYRRGWGMPARPHEVGDPVIIDGLPCIITRVDPLYSDGIADYVRAPITIALD